jgi:hypothetical protein
VAFLLVVLYSVGMESLSIFRRAELERRIAAGISDGASEEELSELVGLPRRSVEGVIECLTARVQSEAGEIARIHAIRQTGQLTALYSDALREWESTRDPRYAEIMRGVLADVRKIWGVEAPQRLLLGVGEVSEGGVLGGILGRLSESELEVLDGIFRVGECDEGAGEDGACLPSSEGVCEVGESFCVGRGSTH